jgi:aminopeptidase YwaD
LLHKPRRYVLIGLVGLAVAACGGESPSKATPTAVPSAAAATFAPTPTADAIGTTAVDGQRAYDHVKKLSVDIGPRVAGTPSEITARDYIRSMLESYGYDVSVQDFGFDATAYLPARVDVGPAPGPSDNLTSIPAIALRGSGGGSVNGRLVAAGIGRPEEFPSGGLAGAIALIERGELTFSQKVGNAIAAGAGGVVIYNNEAGRMVFDLGEPVALPVVSVDQAEGRRLRETAQPLVARITVSPPKGTAYNVVAKPKGAAMCDTITGGHYDSVPVTGGADDNASGTAAVLELARVVAAMKLAPRHCFALFSAEEFGLFGSRAYVERLTAGEKQALRGMVNLDVVGTASSLDLIGDDDLIDVARLAAQKLGVTASPSSLPPNTGSDHLSFQNGGLHAVMLYRADELIHTPEDAIGRIVPASLAETVSVALATLQSLAP